MFDQVRRPIFCSSLLVGEDALMRLVVSSRASLLQEQQVVGYSLGIEILLCCYPFFRPASASADSPSFVRSCSAEVVPPRLFLVSYADCCIGTAPRSHFLQVQAQANLLVLHSVLPTWVGEDHGMLPETKD